MKHTNCRFEYEDERGKDLLRAYKSLIAQSKEICLDKIYKELVFQPSSRFWVSGGRAAIVISDMMRGKNPLKNMRQTKREMFEEIYRRFKALQHKMPGKTIQEYATIVVDQEAPKFYMEAETARKIIQIFKKKCLEETKQRLRHCFWMPRK